MFHSFRFALRLVALEDRLDEIGPLVRDFLDRSLAER